MATLLDIVVFFIITFKVSVSSIKNGYASRPLANERLKDEFGISKNILLRVLCRIPSFALICKVFICAYKRNTVQGVVYSNKSIFAMKRG